MRSLLRDRALSAIVAAFSLLWICDAALAGTTGTIVGTVDDSATKVPIAGATVIAVSPSQVARVTTDASGRFIFLSLAPDTYTITAQHAGFESLSVAGISVLADQSQTVAAR
jgi:Carboxypeptidase regulatory-like domain